MHKMIEQIKYINHMNEVIEFGKDGIFVNYNTLRDYSWDITSANNKIASFKKGIVSKTIPVIIKCQSEEEGIEIRNRLFEVFEKDVLAKKNGRIVIGEYYLKCYITGSKKTKYLINDGYMHLSLTMKSDYPAWIKESYTIFRPKSALNTSESAEGREILIGNATNSILTNYAVYGRSEQKSYSGKNELENLYGDRTSNGIEVVVNDDKSWSLSGTATGDIWFQINDKMSLPADSYILSGATSDVNIRIGTGESNTYLNYDTGSGVTFTLTEETQVFISARVLNGVTVNTTIYPMIRKASITDATYEPYVGGEPSPNPSYPQDIESVADKGKNQIATTAISQTINGVEFEVNSDGSVTINGTATADAKLIVSEIKLPIGDYVAYGGYDVNCDLWCYSSFGSNPYMRGGGNPFHVQVFNEDTTLTFYILVTSGTTVDNKTVFPMVINSMVKNDTYEPPYNFLWVNTHNKNLLEYTYENLNPYTTNGITFLRNDDRSISVSGTATANAILRYDFNNSNLVIGKEYTLSTSNNSENVWLTFGYFKADEEYISALKYTKTSANFTVPSDYVRNRCYISVDSGTTVNETIYPMIRKASIEDDSYEPYKATKATIILDDSLRGIKVSEGGNFTDETGQQWVCDTLEKYADGLGKLVQRVYHKVFDGTEDIYANTSSPNGGARFEFIDNNIKLNVNSGSVTGLICNRLTEKTPNYSWGENSDCIAISANSRAMMFRLASLNITDVTTLKSQLKSWYDAGEPMEFICEMAEYVETPLTAEQVAEIEKLQTFEGITYITNNGNAYQEVTYSIKQYLDFPYGYEYDFTADFDSDVLLNTSFVPVDFRMVIHGAITNPSVFISGHEYSVDVVLDEGDYLTIDSQAKTIVLSKRDGTQVNCFNNRNRDSYVFEKIPSGKNEITSAGDLNMDIVLLDERSEPRWT